MNQKRSTINLKILNNFDLTFLSSKIQSNMDGNQKKESKSLPIRKRQKKKVVAKKAPNTNQLHY